MKLIEFTDYHDNPVYINPHYVVRVIPYKDLGDRSVIYLMDKNSYLVRGNVKDVINLLQRK
jgi:hypothetical protein